MYGSGQIEHGTYLPGPGPRPRALQSFCKGGSEETTHSYGALTAREQVNLMSSDHEFYDIDTGACRGRSIANGIHPRRSKKKIADLLPDTAKTECTSLLRASIMSLSCTI